MSKSQKGLGKIKVPKAKLPSKTDNSEEYYNKGLEQISSQKYEKAIESFDKALKVDPSYYKAHIAKGNAFAASGDGDRAIESYQNANEIKPTAEAYTNEANVLFMAKNYEQALLVYDKAIGLDPRSDELYINRGNSLAALGAHNEAVESFNSAIIIKPSTDAYNSRANVFLAIEDYNEAVESFNSALDIKPTAEAYYGKGVAFQGLGRYQYALKAYNKAIEINPHWAIPYHSAGIVLAALNRNAEAINNFDKAIDLAQSYDQAYNNRGDALLALGQNEGAFISYLQASELRPDISLYPCNQAKVLDSLGMNADVPYQTVYDLVKTKLNVGIQETLREALTSFCQSEIAHALALAAGSYLVEAVASSIGLTGDVELLEG